MIKIINNKILISFLLLIVVTTQAACTNSDAMSDVALIRSNLMPWAVSYRKSGDLPRKSVSEYLSLLNPDGSFSDKKSTIDVMRGRLVFMAQAFKNDPKWKNNTHLKTNLYNAVQYWLDHNPGNSGWCAGCFSEPSSMDVIGLCIYDAIQNDKVKFPAMANQLNSLSEGIIEWANAAWTVSSHGEFFTGANVAYRLMGMIGRAALADSPEMFDNITNITLSTFMIGDLYYVGRHADESWHQHNAGGGQNYWLGYGADWLHLTRESYKYLKNTRWELSDAQLNIFADCILDGWQWLIYRNQGVYSLLGRHNLKKKNGYDFDFMVGQIDSLRELAGEKNLKRNDELEQLKKRLTHSPETYPSFDDSKYFYKSDLMIYGKPNYYVATKMLSKRTAGPESGNGEGKKNYHFGEGSTIIFKTGKEYTNARVGWNYRAIPGTTVEQKTDTLPLVDWGGNANSRNKFAGGIAEGNYGLCAFQLNRVYKYSTVTANKGYFFFNDGFAALGSMIKKNSFGGNNEVWTTIDQPERKSDITYFINGKSQIIPLSKSVQVDFTNITDGAWFYCNGKGYIIFPDKRGVNLKLWAEKRRGDWHDLDVTYRRGDIQTVNIFQLSINHSAKPENGKYAYLVFPDITEKKMSNYFANMPVKILENSDSAQAVQFVNSNITEIAFYKPAKIKLNDSLTVSVDRPAVVMLQESCKEISVSIADPNQEAKEIIMDISGKLSGGTNIIYNAGKGISRITFTLPQGIYSGKSIRQRFRSVQ